MATKRSLIQRVSLVRVSAVMFGAAAAVLVAATPQWLFDATVDDWSMGAALSFARAPFGLGARLLAIVAAFSLVGLAVWLVGRGIEALLSLPRTPTSVEDHEALDLVQFPSAVPLPATPRRPIFADQELGAPLMSDEALATAATYSEPFPPFDPSSFEDGSVEHEPVATRARGKAATTGGEGSGPKPDATLQAPLAIEEFDVPLANAEAETLSSETSLDALIRRLEASLARRAGPNPPHPGAPAITPPVVNPRDWMVREPDTASFDEDATRALGTFRRMAR